MKVVIVNAFDTYEHRVELLYSYFKMNHCNVHVYASDFQHIKKTYRNIVKEDYTFIHTKAYKKNLSVSRLQSHKEFSEEVYRKIKDQDIDLLWVFIPPNSLTSMAACYKQYHNRTKLILDLIDLWPETMPIHSFKNIPPLSWWKNMRDNNLQYADLIVTECNLYQEKLRKIIQHQEARTLYLAREYHEYFPVFPQIEDTVKFCYLGSINNIIDIPQIKRVLGNLQKDIKTEVHIIGDGEKREEFIRELEKASVSSVFYGKIFDYEEKRKIVDQCHFGINMMKESVCVGLTMKSMDYFEYGIPLLNNIKGDTWKIIEKYGVGYNLKNPEDISWKELKDKVNMRQKVRKVGEKLFTIESFYKTMDQIMRSCHVEKLL